MPVISDPGYRLVQLAIRHNIPVVPIPGASALVAALSAAGLPVDKFRFLGFLPPKKSQRRKAIEELRGTQKTLAVYEAPHRLLDMLEDVKDILGDPPVVVAREVTKVHEEFCRGTASEVIARFKKKPVKGEITVLIAPQLATRPVAHDEGSIREDVRRLMSAEGLDERTALKSVARTRGIPRSDAYRQMQGEKNSEK
jgi:16S rRNA (cytidine1402-2'-O)-methyltransferase